MSAPEHQSPEQLLFYVPWHKLQLPLSAPEYKIHFFLPADFLFCEIPLPAQKLV
jgi:hypothetical protein